MSREEAKRSLEVGIEVFEAELASKIFGMAATGDMGIGNTTASTAMAAVFTGHSVRKLVGRGTGIGDEALERKIGVIEGALALHKPSPADPLGVLFLGRRIRNRSLGGRHPRFGRARVSRSLGWIYFRAAALLAEGDRPAFGRLYDRNHVSGDAGPRPSCSTLLD